ncbi:MAG: PqqD family protein [Bacteroidales bacterium]|nr:PqqD family protein [Bacteroidales bacterium]MCF6341565.1 PqqD family protein [Bacteroidales bacterium]
MELAAKLKVNTPNVVHETIDGEAILLDLKTGNYFSLDGSAALIWEFIDKTGNWAEAVNLMTSANKAQKDNISASVKGFVEKLVEENLLVKTDGTGADAGELTGQLSEAAKNFKPPVVNKYSDMQDLLLLDPIHDVDEKGWPESKEEPPAA